MKSLILTGPESTGKSTIAQHISQALNVPLISEYSREYLNERNGQYKYEDIAKMARKSQEIINSQDSNLIIDTDILTYKIWSDYKFSKTDPWIEQNLISENNQLYLLCYPDLPWEKDPLRENPHDRLVLFSAYEGLILSLKLDYYIICGKKSRLNNALEIATNYFNY